MWVAQLVDGTTVQDVRQVATYNHTQSPAFFLSPFDWTDDNVLLFERSLTGIGGYILYAGHTSLYSYDPTTGQIATYVPAEGVTGLCVDTYDQKLERVVLMCGKEGPEMVIRNLMDGSEQPIPTLPEQVVAGSSQFSPSGQWLAYAVARSIPEDESGQVVVVPADLSSPPTPIAQVAENSFPAVNGWLDEDTLVFSRNQWPNGSVFSIQRDGSGLTQLAEGFFAGWIR